MHIIFYDTSMKILGIETSCDETAAAIVTDDRKVLAHKIRSQITEHKPYGGVVPEIAARAHMDVLDRLIKECMHDSNIKQFTELDGISVTAEHGLIGVVIVGVMMSKAIDSASRIPFIALNHLEGHALTVRLEKTVNFPYLLLLVSGGHCQFLSVENVGRYTQLGCTLDDALGEAFDKVAKMMGLGYPGGPLVEEAAKTGNPTRFKFPRSLVGREGCDLSFSGLKTAVRREIEALPTPLSQKDIHDICASFQTCVGDILENRLEHAIDMHFRTHHSHHLVIAGGVAANLYIREKLQKLCHNKGLELAAPSIALCTDNAAMIAWAGIERLKAGFKTDLSFAPKARWPLEELALL
jgi:N6-L-threonylcarbamoyladenine synthase